METTIWYAHCTCGWQSEGYTKIELAHRDAEEHGIAAGCDPVSVSAVRVETDSPDA